MSTRSRIGVELNDGSIKSIYCHFDGYPTGVGYVLKTHYKDIDKVIKLLDLGDISSLGSEYDERISRFNWSLDKTTEDEDYYQKRKQENLDGFTTAYKDRGEDDIEARLDKDISEFEARFGDCCEEYMYLFKQDESGKYSWKMYSIYGEGEEVWK